MGFQKEVRAELGFGVVGEQYLDGPMRAQPGVTASANAENNVVGRVFTVVSDATASYDTGADPRPLAVAAGGAAGAIFAGILAHPKAYVLYGTLDGGPLGPSLVLPDNTPCELVQEAAGMIVAITTAGGWKIGDLVYYNQTTGEIVTAAPDAAAPEGATRVPGGRTTRYNSAAPGLGVITFNSNVDVAAAAAAGNVAEDEGGE